MMSINHRTTEKGDNHLFAIPCGLAVCIKKGCVHLATNICEIAANDKTEEGLLLKMFLI